MSFFKKDRRGLSAAEFENMPESKTEFPMEKRFQRDFAIDIYDKDNSVCIDIEWQSIHDSDRIVLSLTPLEARTLIRQLEEALEPDHQAAA